MSGPPDGELHDLRRQLRLLSAQHLDVLVPSRDIVLLLDLLDEQTWRYTTRGSKAWETTYEVGT